MAAEKNERCSAKVAGRREKMLSGSKDCFNHEYKLTKWKG